MDIEESERNGSPVVQHLSSPTRLADSSQQSNRLFRFLVNASSEPNQGRYLGSRAIPEAALARASHRIKQIQSSNAVAPTSGDTSEIARSTRTLQLNHAFAVHLAVSQDACCRADLNIPATMPEWSRDKVLHFWVLCDFLVSHLWFAFGL